MTNQTEPQADVFDMSRTVPTADAVAELDGREEIEPKPKQAKKTISLPTGISFAKVKKYAVPAGLVLLFVVGGVWSFMPAVFSLGGGTSPAPRSASYQPAFTPADAMRGAGREGYRDTRIEGSDPGRVPEKVATATVAEPASPAVRGAEPGSLPQVAAVAPHDVPMIDNELKIRVATLEQSLTELQAKLALLEGRQGVDATGVGSNAQATKLTNAKAHDFNPAKAKAARVSRSVKPPSKPISTTPVNKAFTLNTIYAGQAWIQDSEQVYVVQVGDLVGDMQIQSIDPKGRRVLTTKGVIR